MNFQRKERLFLWGLFFFALALRLGYLFYLQKNYFFFNSPGEDVAYYKNWAKAIVFAEAESQTTFAGMPLFPHYLAVLFRIFQGNWQAINIFNLAVGAFNCVLVFWVAQKWFPCREAAMNRIAAIAGILTATNFILIYYDWLMMPITVLITLTLLILLALSEQGPTSKKDWGILGMMIGLASLGDAKFLIFAVLLMAYLFLSRDQSTPVILCLFLGLALVVGGVTLRNKIVDGNWVFITSQSGLSLYVGNNPKASGAYEHPEFLRPSHEGQDLDQRIFVEQKLGRPVSSKEVSDFYRREALDFIFHDPIQYLKLLGKKLVLFASDNEQSQAIDLILQRGYKHKFDVNSYLLIFPLAMIGIFFALKSKKEIVPAILLLLSQLVFFLIYFVSTRHRASILPVLIIFQALTFNWVVEEISQKKIRPLLITLITTLFFVFAFPPRFLEESAYQFLLFSKSGSVYEEQKNYAAASQAYAQALFLQPQDTSSIYNLATAYVNLKEYKKAKRLFERALETNPANVDVLFNLGYVFEQTGEIQTALQYYQKVVTYSPESIDAHFRIASLYQAQGQCDQAQPHLSEIIRHKPILKSEIEKIFLNCR